MRLSELLLASRTDIIYKTLFPRLAAPFCSFSVIGGKGHFRYLVESRLRLHFIQRCRFGALNFIVEY